MINAIKNQMYYKYGITISKKHIVLAALLVISAIILLASLSRNSTIGKKNLTPRPAIMRN